jgi:MATE family multidrug resistance protein
MQILALNNGATQTSFSTHAKDVLKLAAPIAIAQLSQVAMGVTDTVLLGSIGAQPLAAGGLGTSLFFTVLIILQGILTSVSVFVAQARGSGAEQGVPDIYRTGLVLAILLSLPAFLLLSAAGPILLMIGESPALAHDVDRYAHVLRWGAPGAMVGIGMMRAFLPAIGAARWLLWVSLCAMILNGFLNYGLIHGAWGLPTLGFLGSATATVFTLWLSALVLLGTVHARAAARRFVDAGRVRGKLLRAMLSLGWPVAVTYGVETAMFLAVGLLMGLLGPAALAAHQIALNVASTSFMVTLAIAQAANVRVGFWIGAGRRREARRAGFVAIALGAAFMVASGLVLIAAPHAIVGFYLDERNPANAATVAIAVSLLVVAAVFQVVDGTQVVAAGCLRGLEDTRVPMLLATLGYWGVGFGISYALAFHLGLGAAGLWWGLAAGLAAVACALTLRFHFISRSRAEPRSYA